MTPGTFNLNLYRGDSYRWAVNVWMDAAKTQPADLTGVTAKAEIRDKPAGVFIVAMACTVALPNTVDMVLDAEASSQVPAAGAWDLQLTWPSGDVGTILAGKVKVTADVTDSTPSSLREAVAVAV